MSPSTVAAGALGAVVVAGASPYLARLTISAPDRADRGWWWARQPVCTSRVVVTAVVGLVIGALAGASAGWSAAWPAFTWLALVATPLVVIDVEHHRLPDRLVFAALSGGALLLGAAALVGGDGRALLRASAAAVVVFAVFFVLALAAPVGFGDTKLAGVLAGYLGWRGWVYVPYGIAAGFCVGALVSLPLLITRRVGLRTAIPFGPALVVGALLVSGLGLVPDSLT